VKRTLICIISLITVISLNFSIVLSAEETQTTNTGTTYYIDSVKGSDFNSGKSESKPWKSLSKINNTTFLPGDKILFRAGGLWNGQLTPKGSGAEKSPIIIDMYGKGNKPVISVSYDSSAKVGNKTKQFLGREIGSREEYYIFSLLDQSYWEVNNLELNGNMEEGCMRGICIFAEETTVKHVYLKKCFVRNIVGSVEKLHGGIYYQTIGYEKVSSFNDILIEDNLIMNVNRSGISIDICESKSERITNAVIRGNFLDTIGGDGIVPKGCIGTLVEYNIAKDCNTVGKYSNVAMWPYNAIDTLFQFNEAYLTRSMHDGQGFDCDYKCRGTTFQYNYSHDNEGGFMLVCCLGAEDGSAFNEDITIRYNISQNDHARTFQIAGPIKNCNIYNNTFYLPGGEAVMPLYGHAWGVGLPKNIVFCNNIIYNNGYGEYQFHSKEDTIYKNNLFYGNHPKTEPDDPYKITKDPMLVAPNTGGLGIDTVDGYKLKEGSPAVGAGMIIEDNGGRDYWGNEVKLDEKPNIGAYNGTCVK